MAVYGFDQASAQRIGDAVRRVEGRRVGPRSSSGADSSRSPVGVRCMLGTIGTAAWGKGSSGTVTLFSGEPGSEASVETLSAYNYVSDIAASTATGRYVALSNNGYGWIVVESEQEGSVTLSTAVATYVANVDVAASLNTATCAITVSKTVTTASIVYVSG